MRLGKENHSVAILAVVVLNLIFVAPLRRADLRPGKVLSCCRNEMGQQDQDKTRMSTVKISQRRPDSEQPECRLDVVQERWGVLGASWFHASAGRRAIQMCLCRKVDRISQGN
jgi:hypothetical protein